MLKFERNYLAFFAVVTIFAGLTYAAVQQSFRQGANDPQIQMAEDTAKSLSQGHSFQSILKSDKIDIASSLSPYIVIFNSNGEPIASSGFLDGQMPKVPLGVFDYVRMHEEDRVTWEPKPGVRSAAVVRSYTDDSPGFVLVGRSLREVEERVDMLFKMVAIAWLMTIFSVTFILLAKKPRKFH